ncbi:MAG: Gfo/Idh/MocA family oxidoreductase [Acidobacteriaceae bacterium]|nr:Gfo/Idh/MocA family oxidoreductase [Acidobacteriaceae bacterium]
MRVGLLGTGAIANKHAQAYRNLGFELAACSNKSEARGREFAARWNCEFVGDYEALCHSPALDYVDVCTFPDFHLPPVLACAEIGRHILLQKPMATNLDDAQCILEAAHKAGIVLGVVSQKRFDDPIIFLKRALAAGRLGKLIEADAYVKWFRSDEYYSRPIKGSWEVEGGGALMNQAIHQVDLLLYLAGPLERVQAMWQIGARHRIEAEDVVNALLGFRSGITGVIQASTAFWPGYTERIEIHGTKGSAIVSGDRLTSWDALNDEEANAADPAPVEQDAASGSSDPMAIRLTSFERQFTDFAAAIRSGRKPLTDGEAGYRALEAVLAVYTACRESRFVQLTS